MDEITKSSWFALVTGLASVIGMLLTLYPLRVKHKPTSRLRTLEWTRNLKISIGFGIAVFSAIQFYNQPPPGLPYLRDFYDALHGFSGSKWEEGEEIVSAIGVGQYHAVHIKSVGITHKDTTLKFEYWLNHEGRRLLNEAIELLEEGEKNLPSIQQKSNNSNSSSSNRNAPVNASNNNGSVFSPAVQERYRLIRYSYGGLLDMAIKMPGREVLPAISTDLPIDVGLKDAALQGGNGSVAFPSILGREGNFGLNIPPNTDIIDLPEATIYHDYRGSGTFIWPFVFIIGLTMMIRGQLTCPICLFKNTLYHEVKALQREEEDELRAILNDRIYEDLSAEEKRKYDQTLAFFTKMQAVMFEALSGQKNKPTVGSEDTSARAAGSSS